MSLLLIRHMYITFFFVCVYVHSELSYMYYFREHVTFEFVSHSAYKMLENVVMRSEFAYTREQHYTKVIIIIIISTYRRRRACGE